ncbi:hypothetical protein [Anaerolentibacter hominis]|uniref:hypothetical protein n=1 Tax=Anaerolentibacter hominis TaxID=3079009 RepID=UPI0031B85E77
MTDRNDIKRTPFIRLSLLSFGAFLLEYFSIFVIEGMLFQVDIWNYTPDQRANHCILMAFLWAAVISGLLFYSRKRYHYPAATGRPSVPRRDWFTALLCLAGCKIMTFIDWNTFKILGEAEGKSVFQFCAQYLYYVFEVGLVLLIILYGQKAFETRLKRESRIPFGGLVLAMTWGVFHFVSRGVGLELWNGISCMLFSVLSGIIYLKLRRRPAFSYLFIAVGYLL